MLIILVILFIFLTFYGYIGWSIIRHISRRKLLKVLICATLFFFAAITPITQILNHTGYNSPFIIILNWISLTSFGFFSLLFIFFLLRDIGFISTEMIAKFIGLFSKKDNINSKDSYDPSRRKFIFNSFNAGIIGFSGLMGGVGLYKSRYDIQIKKIKIPIKNLPKSLQNIKIIQLTDLHIGLTITKDFIEEIVKKTMSLNGDVIVFTGDLVDGSVANLTKDVEPLSDLQAPLGKFFVTGNHEYYSGVIPWLKKVEELGFMVLHNENSIINWNKNKILMAGVTDFNGGRFSSSHISNPHKAKKVINNNYDLSILLAHQPRTIFQAAKAGFDVQLSGHTHGGQYFPWNLFVKLQQPFVAGLHQYNSTKIYVSRGAGYWGPPLRIGAPAEITEITFKNA